MGGGQTLPLRKAEGAPQPRVLLRHAPRVLARPLLPCSQQPHLSRQCCVAVLQAVVSGRGGGLLLMSIVSIRRLVMMVAIISAEKTLVAVVRYEGRRRRRGMRQCIVSAVAVVMNTIVATTTVAFPRATITDGVAVARIKVKAKVRIFAGVVRWIGVHAIAKVIPVKYPPPPFSSSSLFLAPVPLLRIFAAASTVRGGLLLRFATASSPFVSVRGTISGVGGDVTVTPPPSPTPPPPLLFLFLVPPHTTGPHEDHLGVVLHAALEGSEGALRRITPLVETIVVKRPLLLRSGDGHRDGASTC